MSQETYNAVFLASHWLFVFFALMLLLFAFSWHHADRKERKDRFKNLPGAGTIGELVVLSGSNELPPDTWFPVPRKESLVRCVPVTWWFPVRVSVPSIWIFPGRTEPAC